MLAGRVHGAVISNCNEENRTVSVQWVENNETKGKEIDFGALVRINKLQSKSSPPAAQQQQKQQQKPAAPPAAKSGAGHSPKTASPQSSPSQRRNRPTSPKRQQTNLGPRRQTNIKVPALKQPCFPLPLLPASAERRRRAWILA